MKKRHLRALSFIMSAILLAGCTTTPTVGTGTQEAAQASETGTPEAAEDGSAGGETKETEAAVSQQEFPPLNLPVHHLQRQDISVFQSGGGILYPFLQSDSDRGAAQGMGAYRGIF